MAAIMQRSTNLNFPRKAKFSQSSDSDKTRAYSTVVVPPHSATPNIFRKKSKISIAIDGLTSDLRRYPQIRPSVCTIIIGLSILFFALLMLGVTDIRQNTPLWFQIIAIIVSALVIIGGFVGLARNYFLLKKRLEFQRNQASKLASLARGTFAAAGVKHQNDRANLGTVIEETNVDLANERLDYCTGDVQQQSQVTNQSVDRIQKIVQTSHRRKLPSLPIVKTRKSSANENGDEKVTVQHLDQIGDNNNLKKKRKHGLTYFSSEPDLLTCGKHGGNLYTPKRTGKFVEKENLQHSKCVKLETTENSSELADEIFEVFHDPLLYTAITRLKFKCDYEFLSA